MPAVGKSTVGKLIAKQLGYQFLDTDTLIQEKENRSLKDIILEEGNEGFLEIENRINCDVVVDHAVIAPGGSIIYCREAMEHFKKIGTVVYLNASYGTIEKRIESIQNRGVILKPGQTLRDLYNERIILLKQYADVTVIHEGLDIEETIDRVLKALESFNR